MQINETDIEKFILYQTFMITVVKCDRSLGTLKHWFNELSVGLKSYLEEPGLNHNSQG